MNYNPLDTTMSFNFDIYLENEVTYIKGYTIPLISNYTHKTETI